MKGFSVEQVQRWHDEQMEKYRKPMTGLEIESYRNRYSRKGVAAVYENVIVDEWPEPVEINVYPLDHKRGGQPMARFKGVVKVRNDGDFMRVFQSHGKGDPASATVPISKLSFWCVLKADAP